MFLEPVPGTIVAWIPLEEDSEPPNKWQICDGKRINSGDWEGKQTPDLTNKFLIGQEQRLVNSLKAELDELTHTKELEYSGTREYDRPYKMTIYDVVYIMRID